MAENSGIQWCGPTFNCWIGCSRKSPGCAMCYAEAMMDHRMGRVKWGPKGERSRTSTTYWKQPLRWNRKAVKASVRERVFCASLADVFDEHKSIKQEWRDDLWDLIGQCEQLDWLLLTKRPENIGAFSPLTWATRKVPKNVWLGTSVEDQERADERIPLLKQWPATVRFLSCEPLIGPVDLRKHLDGIDWVVCGGESGALFDVRVMEQKWLEDVIAQCKEANVSVFVKQMGTGLRELMTLKNKKGGDMDEWPEHLKIREYPTPKDRDYE